ncbi:hypothetical protein [Halorubrum sp. Atlit-9R]|nr:hypothetical protein [Halorubrum sp. Atlit-9R]
MLGLNEGRIHFFDFPMMKLDTEALIDVNFSFEETGPNPMCSSRWTKAT